MNIAPATNRNGHSLQQTVARVYDTPSPEVSTPTTPTTPITARMSGSLGRLIMGGSLVLIGAMLTATVPVAAQRAGSTTASSDSASDVIKTMVGQLDLERYKATIKGLTQFGDRREGTDRNRAAADWIEAKLRSYGCTPTERLTYDFQPRPPRPPISAADAARYRARQGTVAEGGSRVRRNHGRRGVNVDSLAQPDPTLRALDTPPSVPGERQEVYCTKVGTKHPGEMYIVSAHMDGKGWGEAANDDGSGTALVMELARIFSSPNVQTDRSIRFMLWNNEETGYNGSLAYVAQRQALQGKESPVGSGKYPEPKWLGVIQHDMMMFDHGMPRSDSSVSDTQRPEADMNIEFQSASKFATESQRLAWVLANSNEKYATDYPATVGQHMTNTDSGPFQDLVASVSVRENERGAQTGAGWNPHWHQPTDLYSTYTDSDFRLGLNAAQTTLGATATLAGASLVR